MRSVLIMLSNLLSIAFSLHRYAINSSSLTKTGGTALLKKAESVSVVAVTAVLLGVSLVLNLNTLFVFVPTHDLFEGDENSIRAYPSLNFNMLTTSTWFVVIFYVNLLLREVACSLAIFVVDLFLLRSVRENLRKKSQITGGNVKTNKKSKEKRATEEMVKKTMLFSLFPSMDKIQQLNVVRKFRENKSSKSASSKEFKITLMVALNGASSLLLRLPVIFVSLMLISLIRRQLVMITRERQQRFQRLDADEEFNDTIEFNYNVYNELAKIAYLVSILLKSLIYYTFDRNFARGIRRLLDWDKLKKIKNSTKTDGVVTPFEKTNL